MDEMQVGDLIPLENGWFREVSTGRVFKMDEDGQLVFPVDEGDEYSG